jgi:hypothetical protein
MKFLTAGRIIMSSAASTPVLLGHIVRISKYGSDAEYERDVFGSDMAASDRYDAEEIYRDIESKLEETGARDANRIVDAFRGAAETASYLLDLLHEEDETVVGSIQIKKSVLNNGHTVHTVEVERNVSALITEKLIFKVHQRQAKDGENSKIDKADVAFIGCSYQGLLGNGYLGRINRKTIFGDGHSKAKAIINDLGKGYKQTIAEYTAAILGVKFEGNPRPISEIESNLRPSKPSIATAIPIIPQL